jgi:hypothetical protein
MPDFRGRPACSCQVVWLPAFEAEAQRRGILTGPLPLSQIIGGAPQSGGTHSTGGADDSYPLDGVDVDDYVWLSRQMGADATWERAYNWDGNGGVRHVHRALRGCPHNGPARYQIAAVDAGFNGLGSGGRGAPDDGPRPLSGRTWQQGIEWANEQAEEADMAEYGKQILAATERLERKVDRLATKERERNTVQRDRDKALAADLDEIAIHIADTATQAKLRAARDRILAALAEPEPVEP